MHLNHRRSARSGAAAGFTLIELLVTLLVVAVGMLGLAKLEAAAISQSQVSRERALMTFQAESLASMMRANRGFWAGTALPFPSFSVAGDGTPPTYPTGIVAGTDPACSTAGSKCSPGSMAYADLTDWATKYSAKFPGATANVSCVAAAGAACAAGGAVPTSYDITLAWTEKSVAINRATAGAGAASAAMILHVQP